MQITLKIEVLLVKLYDELTAWDISEENVIDECVWGRKVQVNLEDDLLLANGNDRISAWDRAVKKENIANLEALSF